MLLESSGLGKYREAFETEQVNGDILYLCELDEDILENDLGVSSRLHHISYNCITCLDCIDQPFSL